MKLLPGVEVKFRKEKVLKFHKNIYRQKQVGCQFGIFAWNNLLDLGWKQSVVDNYVFYKKGTVFIVYVNDIILVNKSENIITE